MVSTATETAELLRRGKLSARELTEATLAAIDAANPAVNAVVELHRDEALRAAAAADEATANGVDLGPLHGVPVTVKDSLDVAGMHTTWGNPAFEDFVAQSDATVVERLRSAGATVIGKTNPAFMLGDFGQTANELYGVTNNPWDTTRTPGGSSGGAAAAVAAGMSFLEYGSDLAGSVRIPAGQCGVYGLKPTSGVVPLTGFQLPGTPRAQASEVTYQSTLGPLARSAGDLRTALRVTGGPDGDAARAYTWRLPRPRHTRLTDHRVGVVLDHGHAPVSSEVGGVLSDVVDALARAGVHVRSGWPEGVDPVPHCEAFGAQVELFLAWQGEGTGASDLADQERRRMASRAAWSRYFDDVDVFLCPVNVVAAPPHDTRPFEERTIATPEGDRPYTDQVFWVSHPSLPGLPAVAAPAGRTRGGLPVGVQVVAARFEDDTAITFAELLADVAGGYVPSPLALGHVG